MKYTPPFTCCICHTECNKSSTGSADQDPSVLNVDAIYPDFRFAEQIDVMKIDVEGTELRVLHGARDTLIQNYRIVLLMDLHPYLGATSVAVCEYLQDLGFSLFDVNLPQSPLVISEQLTKLYAERKG